MQTCNKAAMYVATLMLLIIRIPFHDPTLRYNDYATSYMHVLAHT